MYLKKTKVINYWYIMSLIFLVRAFSALDLNNCYGCLAPKVF